MSGLVFRLFVDGELSEEVGRQPEDGTRIGAHQEALAEAAAQRGQRWMLELFDPDRPTEEAYFRMGSDAEGMRDPKVVLGWHDPRVVSWVMGGGAQ